jgi:phosphoribosyl-ATP pyrophosphohydrolase/phosphoribosyl-AMP cyclohydrolase/histidinol dehydrogenase
MKPPLLRSLAPDEVERNLRPPVPAEIERRAAKLVEEVRTGGEAALRDLAERFGDLAPGDPLTFDRNALDAAAARIDPDRRGVLERTAERIEAFALAQRRAVADVEVPIQGGVAGHDVSPVDRAGCYAPGGRFPLPSSVLMTAVTARAAGVGEIWIASPKPTDETLAAAAIAGATGLLRVGGAQAIAALAFGVGVPACDVLAGPGNDWVTAAKKVVSGVVGIDLLAGPSELVVLADDSADPDLVAADLLAQAEHDVRALPVLVTTSATLPDRVEERLAVRLAELPTADTAGPALTNGYVVRATDLDAAIRVVDRLAPEHLEVLTADAEAVSARIRHYGGLFVGPDCAEVAGDYGAGPNHTLPTGGGARYTGGLSVLAFLRVRTWMRIDRPEDARALYADAAALAAMEGLDGHRRAAELRRDRS